MRRRRIIRTWQTQWSDDWQAIRPILQGAPTLAWHRLVGRIIDHLTPDYVGLVRTRVLIEELYAERAAQVAVERWIDPHTRSVLTAAMCRLPVPERALAEGELAVLEFQDQWKRQRRRLHRVTLLLPLIGSVLGIVLAAVGFGWIGLAVIVLAGAVSYGLQAAAWIKGYRIVRRIWRAYAAQGGQPFW